MAKDIFQSCDNLGMKDTNKTICKACQGGSSMQITEANITNFH
jgi:hypothetical protein